MKKKLTLNSGASLFKFTLSIAISLFFLISFSFINVSAHESHIHPWGYEGGSGPDHWGEMEKDHEKHLMCREGVNQSPVDISHVPGVMLDDLGCHYLKAPIRIMNNTHTIHLSYDAGSYANWGNEKFELIQFHFHRHSEHLVNGKPYPMEMHLVHKTPDHQYVVIGVFINKGKHNPEIQKIWNRIPKEINKEFSYENELIDLATLLPQNHEYFHYNGSLTTPPCSENVSWFLLETPIEMSETQIKYFEKFIDHNARPVQKLNHRIIVKIK
jgi:carbonic anhydrase